MDRVRDGALTASAFVLAFTLTQYLNRKTGVAFPSRAELARATGFSVRTVQTLLTALVDDGHIEIQSGRGRHKVNTYRPLLTSSINRKQASPFVVEKRKPSSPYQPMSQVQSSVEKGEMQRQERGSTFPTEPSSEPSEEPSETIEDDLFPERLKELQKKKRTRTRIESLRQTTVPADWPDANQRAWAVTFWHGEGHPLLATRVSSEASKARDHHLAKDSRFADWDAAWRTWCRKALEFTQAHPQPQGASYQGASGSGRRPSRTASEAAQKLRDELGAKRSEVECKTIHP